MKKILVLGAGMVAGPLIRYLLERDYELTVTSLVLEDAVKLLTGHEKGRALTLDLGDEETLSRLVGEHDLVISLVPYSYHPLVANHCLQQGRNLITASYVHVPDAGDFEAYPNRDSLIYRDIYQLGDEVRSVFRGTLRYIGWCNTMYHMVNIGMLDTEPRDCRGMTYADYMRDLLDAGQDEDLRVAAANRMGIPADCLPPWNMHWLGLFSRQPIGRDSISPLDALGQIMQQKLAYRPGERDMVVLFHEFKAWFEADNHYERLTSTLVDFGVRYGDSSMSRTVSLPAAIAARLILEGKIPQRGVVIPVFPEIYDPVLDELAELNIVCKEEKLVY
jgi:saccharopine dehydrogenase (NADP+, L-glutamate forming)